MNDRQMDQLLDAWLDTGPSVAPSRVTEATRLEIRYTRQPAALRGWPSRKFHVTNNAIRIALATTVVAVAALLGFTYLVAPNVGGPGVNGSSPSPSPRPMPAAEGPLESGTYSAGDAFSVPVTFTLPAGWRGSVPGPYRLDLGWRDKLGGVYFSKFRDVSVDPCDSDQGYLSPQPGPSVDDLVTALADMPGIRVTDLKDVSVGGYAGTQLTMSAPDSFAGCSLGSDGYMIWRLPLGWAHTMTPAERDRVWILDVNGERLVIVARELPGYTDEQRAEVQGILDSIRIEPTR